MPRRFPRGQCIYVVVVVSSCRRASRRRVPAGGGRDHGCSVTAKGRHSSATRGTPPSSAAADAAARAGPAGRMTAFYMLSIGPRPHPHARRVARAALGLVVVLALAIAMTWPLAAGFGTYGRTRGVDADGMYAIWNVSWVAHALTSDPRQLFDANIFHPHRWALAFSELNIVAGIVGIPGWLLTRNPLVAHNSALLFAFCTSTIGAWLLARRLTGSGGAAIVTAFVFGFCP